MMNCDLIGTKRAFADKATTFTNPAVSQAYVNQRPSYSEELFQVVADYCRETLDDLNLALDVGCGPGNSTLGFTKHFKRVIGTDISPEQIAAAPKDIPNCEFKIANSHQHSFIETGSVDLFSCGEAFHFMDFEKVFQEAERVLRPGGTIAIFGYNQPKSCLPSVHKFFHELYSSFLPYFDPCVRHVMEEYKSVELPYPDWKRHNGIKVRYTTTPKRYLDTLNSLATFATISKDNPQIVKEVEQGLTQAVKADKGDTTGLEFEYHYEIILLLGHKPIKR